MMSGSASVENALRCLGRGFDVSCDFRLKYCKGKVAAASDEKAELIVPGFGAFRDVPVDVKCDKGDRIRFRSDVLEFNKMSELFNQRSSLSGKIPSGLFNSMFLFDGSSWAQDAAKTKCLALDGYFISLFNLRLDSQPLALSSHIVDAVPSTWDPAAIASFIENYGTHIIAPEAFNVFDTQPKLEGLCPVTCKEGVTVICSKRGGDASVSSHSEWLLTVPKLPDVINFTFVPITSLLKGVPGTGFLSHAINLYLRYKPPINELKYFLDFQHHKMWAPMHNDLPLGPSSNRSVPTPALQFTPMGPKLCVNTNQVIVKKWPVTGMRLHLEGKKNNRLAIHLQHLTCTPKFIKVQPDKPPLWRGSDDIADERYCEPVQWKMFAHVCTAPVKYDPNWLISGRGTAFIVTGAQLDIKVHESTNVLHLRLLYSEVPGCIVSQSKWVHSPSGFSEKMSFLSMSFPTSSSGLEKEKQQGPVFNLDSAVFPTGPPVPVGAQKMLKFVDTSHVATGPRTAPATGSSPAQS
uniref:MACPF domain-containing protein n=1 Tax=Ananas comosus var. bracteatus TaxID=296719 RepID=A0A6V7P7V5_ANACO|nr:unnamed protein product [Ananas comosus var. bracteatus]